MAGVISQATSSTDSTTITGAANITTTMGASTDRKDVPKTVSTSLSAVSISDQFSSVARTPATAASHQNQPAPSASATPISKGSRDRPITLGCRQ